MGVLGLLRAQALSNTNQSPQKWKQFKRKAFGVIDGVRYTTGQAQAISNCVGASALATGWVDRKPYGGPTCARTRPPQFWRSWFGSKSTKTAVRRPRDLPSRQVPRRRRRVSRATLNRRMVYCPRGRKNTFCADLGDPVHSTAFSNRPVPRLRLQRRVGHRPDLPTRICCSIEKPLVSFVHASAPNKPSSPCPV